MATDILLLVGAFTAVLFLAVLFVEGRLRPAYDPTHHTGSELELGPRGWVQRANFFLMGGGRSLLCRGRPAGGVHLVAVGDA